MAMSQITISLPDDLVRFVEQAAERECRPVANQVRYWIAQAAREAGPLPPPPPQSRVPTSVARTPEAIAEAKALLGKLEAEQRRLRSMRDMDREARHELRELELLTDVAVLQNAIVMAERFTEKPK
jgi:transposase-like protein